MLWKRRPDDGDADVRCTVAGVDRAYFDAGPAGRIGRHLDKLAAFVTQRGSAADVVTH
jgi:hypothetical protein